VLGVRAGERAGDGQEDDEEDRMSPMINSVNVTEACARALIVLGSGPADVDDFDSRVPRTLAKNGLALIHGQALTISPKGAELLKAYKAKTVAQDSTPKSTQRGKKQRKAEAASRSNAPRSTKPKSPPPTGVVDFDAIRAQIVAHYEADLAACDRMQEIAARVATS